MKAQRRWVHLGHNKGEIGVMMIYVDLMDWPILKLLNCWQYIQIRLPIILLKLINNSRKRPFLGKILNLKFKINRPKPKPPT